MKRSVKRRNLRSLLGETDGLSTVEYIILLVLVAIVGIGAWKTFGNRVRSTVGNSTNQVNDLNNTAASPPP